MRLSVHEEPLPKHYQNLFGENKFSVVRKVQRKIASKPGPRERLCSRRLEHLGIAWQMLG